MSLSWFLNTNNRTAKQLWPAYLLYQNLEFFDQPFQNGAQIDQLIKYLFGVQNLQPGIKGNWFYTYKINS